MVGVRLALWEVVGRRPFRDFLSQLLPLSKCSDLVNFFVLDQAFSPAEIGDDGVRTCDTEAEEVIRCRVQNGIFVPTGGSLVGVVSADHAEHWAVDRIVMRWSRNSVHDYGLMGWIDVTPYTWMLPGGRVVVRADWRCRQELW